MENDKILDEEKFQREIQRLQNLLMIENNAIHELYKFVENDNSYRTETVILTGKSVREALRQLGFLDTYNGEENDID